MDKNLCLTVPLLETGVGETGVEPALQLLIRQPLTTGEAFARKSCVRAKLFVEGRKTWLGVSLVGRNGVGFEIGFLRIVLAVFGLGAVMLFKYLFL